MYRLLKNFQDYEHVDINGKNIGIEILLWMIFFVLFLLNYFTNYIWISNKKKLVHILSLILLFYFNKINYKYD